MSETGPAPARMPVVAIMGRPNVGKSTLFNRLVGRRRAIVHDQPGVTRDRLYARVSWGRSAFTLVDTGGFDQGSEAWDARMVSGQARKALEEADAAILVVDAAAGLTPLDREAASVLRRSGKKVFLAVNKVDHVTRESLTADFEGLGFHPVFPVSAEHGLGVGELLDALAASLPEATPEEQAPVPRLALVGRPNVGKSTLANRILGEERFIVHDQPGTTRDAIDSLICREGRSYLLVDTAGIRRPGRVETPVERVGVVRAKEAISRSDICLMLMDAREMVTDQDAKVAGLILEAGRGCVILVNKWDLVRGGDRGVAEKVVREAMPFMDWAPVVFISALTGLGVHRIFPLVDEIHGWQSRHIPAPELNRFLHQATGAYKPASYHGRAVTFGYMTQARTNPPTFVVLTNEPARVHFTYRRYLANRLREEFGFRGVPLVLRFRAKGRRG